MSRNVLIALAGVPAQYTLFPVIYDIARQRKIVQDLIENDAFGTIARLGLTGQDWFSWWHEIGIQLSTFIFRFKNPDFEKEREWRILSLQKVGAEDAMPVKVRARSGVDVPYIELPLNQATISCIVKGPRCVLGTEAVGILLDQHGFASTEIRDSVSQPSG